MGGARDARPYGIWEFGDVGIWGCDRFFEMIGGKEGAIGLLGW